MKLGVLRVIVGIIQRIYFDNDIYVELLVDDSIQLNLVDIMRDVNASNWGNPLMDLRFDCAVCRALKILCIAIITAIIVPIFI